MAMLNNQRVKPTTSEVQSATLGPAVAPHRTVYPFVIELKARLINSSYWARFKRLSW